MLRLFARSPIRIGFRIPIRYASQGVVIDDDMEERIKEEEKIAELKKASREQNENIEHHDQPGHSDNQHGYVPNPDEEDYFDVYPNQLLRLIRNNYKIAQHLGST